MRLCEDRFGDSVHGFEWERIHSLGEHYLDQVITHQGFPGISQDEYYEWESLLEVAKCYGRRRQIKPLKQHLKEYEKWLYSEKTASNWESWRTGMPSHEGVVQNYEQLKTGALKAMKAEPD
jgi:hypothetical protein